MMNEFAHEMTKKIDDLLERKIKQIAIKAFPNNMNLHVILNDLDKRDIEKTKKKLNEEGYELDVIYPSSDFMRVEKTENGFSASIKQEEIQVQVKKILFTA